LVSDVREEHRLRVFENRVLRILGPKRDEETGGWRELHNEELHNLYSSSSIIRMIKSNEDEMGKAWSTNGKEKNAYKILMGKAEDKRPLGRPRYSWVDNSKMDLRERVWNGMD
jgi:hypothetical protein